MISVFIVITVTKVIVAFMFKLLSRTGVCSKSGLPALRIVIGRYGYKSSFGANKGQKLMDFASNMWELKPNT